MSALTFRRDSTDLLHNSTIKCDSIQGYVGRGLKVSVGANCSAKNGRNSSRTVSAASMGMLDATDRRGEREGEKERVVGIILFEYPQKVDCIR